MAEPVVRQEQQLPQQPLPFVQPSGEFTAWLRAAGLTDLKLRTAIDIFKANEIEGLSDLRIMMEDGNLDKVGLSYPTLSMIKRALGAADGSAPAIQGQAPSVQPQLKEPPGAQVPSHGLPQMQDGAVPAAAAAASAAAAAAVSASAAAAAAAARAAGELAAAEVRQQKAAVDRLALHDAAKAGDEAEVRRVLDAGGDVNWVRRHVASVLSFFYFLLGSVSSSASTFVLAL